MSDPRSSDIDCLSPQALGSRSALETMTLIHDRKVALCLDLERIADSLPAAVDELDCLAVAGTLLPMLQRAHAFEETTIFPAYEMFVAGNDPVRSIDRLRAEHIADECFAADLTEILLAIGHGGPVKDAETFGFMLRGFFDGLRRHVAFEHEHIAPILRATSLTSRSAP